MALLRGDKEPERIEFREEGIKVDTHVLRNQIDLIKQQDHLFILQRGKDGGSQSFNLRARSGHVDHPEDNGGLLNLAKGALDAECLNGIGSLPDAGRIDKAERHTPHVHRIFNHVACGAVDVADDSFLFVEQQVQQFKLNPELDVIGSWIDEFSGNKDNILSIRKVPETHKEIYAFAKKRNPVNHPSVMFKKEAVIAAGGYQHFPLFEDYYLWVRMLKQGFKFYNIQESLLYFRTSPDTFQRRGGKEYLKNENKLHSIFYQMGFISFSRYMANMIVRSLVRLMPNKFRSYLYNRFVRNKK